MDKHVRELEKTISNLKKQLIDVSNDLAETQKKADHLDRIIAAMPGHFYWMDQEGRILGCNDEQVRSIGLSSRLEMIGKTIHDFQPKKKADKILANNDKIMRSGKSMLAEEPGSLANGNEKIYLSHKAPLKDLNGNIIGIIGISTDITAYKHTATTLENIIALMPGHVYWKDKDGVYLGCNDQQAKTLGFTKGSEIVGKKDSDLPWGKGAELFSEIDKKVMDTKNPIEIEEQIIRPNNKPIIFLSKKVPLFDKEKNISGILGISIDITQQKQMGEQLEQEKEKAQSANVAKTEFIANISHDIRTPLSGIINTAQILQVKFTNTENEKFIAHIIEAGKRLLNTLNWVIDFSQYEFAHLPVYKEKFNLKKIIQNTIDAFSMALNKHSIKLSFKYPPHLPQNVIGDRERVNRIILNLIDNAIKFTDKGNISIAVQLFKKLKNKMIYALTISDTGIGIPPDKIPLIFDKFFKVESSHSGKRKGAGLGLAIIKQFINELGGEIEVSSKPNQGTVFTCKIPFWITKNNQLPQVTHKTIKIKKDINPRKLTILLIEDDKICQLSQRLLLENMGYMVDIAEDGTETFKKIHKPYDLIITDLGLPDINGMDLAKKIRATKTPNTNIPIIALTAHISSKDTHLCIESGINEVVHKPMNLNEIDKIIMKLLKKKSRSSNHTN